MSTTVHSPSSKLFALTIGSVGVVYGDIGTSPLYAFREALHAASRHNGALMPDAIIGLLSLILWSLTIIVTVKYVLLLLRADNHGEGGILSLMALVHQAVGKNSSWALILGIVGAGLFYGDALITPAISVLSAVEGLHLIFPDQKISTPLIAIAIMIMVFSMQKHGTEKVAKFFGPITTVWFIALAWGGWLHAKDSPLVWHAFNPIYGIQFLAEYKLSGAIALGAVFLAVTGGEALYADLGHFGKKPVRMAWAFIVMPALMLNYIGQAAMVLAHPETAANVFYLLYPDWALIPMVILATLATIIASQAVITGAYSLTHQATQLGLLPRFRILFTSAEHVGQIYIPRVNWILFAGIIILIEIFRTSSALASAYGIAVTGTMMITTILFFIVARKVWHWPLMLTAAIVIPFIVIELSFFSANLLKIMEGGCVPLLIASFMTLVMFTWVRGNRILRTQERAHFHTMEVVLKNIQATPPQRIEGTALYLSSSPAHAPGALVHNLKHNKVLHTENILVTLRFVPTPHVSDNERIEVERINADFTRVFMSFGYMEAPNVSHGMTLLKAHGINVDMKQSSFYISRRNIMPAAKFGMPLWRDHLFIGLCNNASDAADYFHLPLDRVVELGVQLKV